MATAAYDPLTTKLKPPPLVGGLMADTGLGPVTLGDPNAPSPTPIGGPMTLGNPNAAPPKPIDLADPKMTAPAGAVDPFAASGGGTYVNGGWIPNNNPDEIARAKTAAGIGAAPAAAPATPTPAAPGAPGAPAADPNAPPATVNDAFRKALLDRLNKPVTSSLDDPALKAQSSAYGLQQQRAKERDREALAGRAAATGQSSDLASGGAFNEGLSALEQRQGESQAGFDANLIGNDLQQQRDDLYRYTALAGNTLNADENRALTEKMKNLDLEIQKQQLSQNQSQFDVSSALQKLGIQTQGNLGQSDLDLRKLLGTGGLNLQLLQLLTGNQQFGQSLASNNAQFGANQDMQNFWNLFGGLS